MANGRKFKKGTQLRKRYQCELATGRVPFQPNAQGRIIKNYDNNKYAVIMAGGVGL
jgi:hypothetical protein